LTAEEEGVITFRIMRERVKEVCDRRDERCLPFWGGMVGVEGGVRYCWFKKDGEARVRAVMTSEQYQELLGYLGRLDRGAGEMVEFIGRKAKTRRGLVYLLVSEMVYAVLYQELREDDN
jgi:hypothetical protein